MPRTLPVLVGLPWPLDTAHVYWGHRKGNLQGLPVTVTYLPAPLFVYFNGGERKKESTGKSVLAYLKTHYCLVRVMLQAPWHNNSLSGIQF